MLTLVLLSSALAMGATVPYTINCSLSSAVKENANDRNRVGYITSFALVVPPVFLRQDMAIKIPYNGASSGAFKKTTPNTALVAGIIESFKWNGGPADPIEFVFYVSQDNAVRLKTLVQQTLKSTKIDLGWWIGDYDQNASKWYEASFPRNLGMITGNVAPPNNPQLNVDPAPVPVYGVILYKVTMKVAPPANSQQPLYFANSSTTGVTKPWGLQLGTVPSPGM